MVAYTQVLGEPGLSQSIPDPPAHFLCIETAWGSCVKTEGAGVPFPSLVHIIHAFPTTGDAPGG